MSEPVAPGPAAARSLALGGLGALQAQKLIDLVALRIAPALTAALIAGWHLGSPGAGLIIGVTTLAATAMVEHPRLPLHLIAGARVVVALAAPLLGVAAGWLVLRAAGAQVPGGAVVATVTGASLLVALGGWIKLRVEERIQARVAVIGPVEFA